MIKILRDLIQEWMDIKDVKKASIHRKKVFIDRDKFVEWLKDNALEQTTYATNCWDDSDIMFKKTDTYRQGDWSQEEWDEKIRNFQPEYINYDELIKVLEVKNEND